MSQEDSDYNYEYNMKDKEEFRQEKKEFAKKAAVGPKAQELKNLNLSKVPQQTIVDAIEFLKANGAYWFSVSLLSWLTDFINSFCLFFLVVFNERVVLYSAF